MRDGGTSEPQATIESFERIFRNADGRITLVSGKLGADVRPGTYSAVLRQTGIKEPEQ
jgi:hypothetical protein